ncbi:MAG: hypothetical protein E7562_04665 [Ruminococcaceae bacterium]|nr:hypothetical protein [Oscillospiraceae bacterium]
MDKQTVKIENSADTLFIAHRGLSGIYTENTNAAFSEAAKCSYFGIETDIHPTADGEFVTIHDDTTRRVGNENIQVESSSLQELRSIALKKKVGIEDEGYIPTLSEYIEICKKYGKTAVVELKNTFERNQVFKACELIERLGYMDKCIFISFYFQNLLYIRMRYPKQALQYLVKKDSFGLILRLRMHKIDLDIKHTAVTNELVKKCHKHGIKVNCWTVDAPHTAQKLIESGVDFITTNILE